MRLATTPPAQSNVPTGNMFAADFSRPSAVGFPSSSLGSPTSFTTAAIAQSPAASSSSLSGRTAFRTSKGPSNQPIREHDASEQTYAISNTPMARGNASHYPSTTSTDSFLTGAYGPHNTSVTEPPRHTRPLYCHIPLPYEHVNLHPALDYNTHSPTSLPGPDIRHSLTPATSPPRACLTIVLPSTRQKMTVCPSSSSTSAYCGIVTVWDVLIAVEMVMSRLDSTDDTCLQGFPSGGGSAVKGRRCVCRGHIPSLEYLRQRYGRAGLTKARGDSDVWMLRVGHQ